MPHAEKPKITELWTYFSGCAKRTYIETPFLSFLEIFGNGAFSFLRELVGELKEHYTEFLQQAESPKVTEEIFILKLPGEKLATKDYLVFYKLLKAKK